MNGVLRRQVLSFSYDHDTRSIPFSVGGFLRLCAIMTLDQLHSQWTAPFILLAS